MLKLRLIFGTLMTLFFVGVVVFDGWLDGSVTSSTADDKAVQGTIFAVLIAALIISAHLELAKLVRQKGFTVLTIVALPASILLATGWYWLGFFEIAPHIIFALLAAFSLFGLFIAQYVRGGTGGTLANCGVSCFSIIYLGVLSGFCVAIRVDFGLWPLLMYVFVVKAADIGAYTIGRLFGKHKFSPRISPGKTVEGMCGAVGVAMIVAVVFGAFCGIMSVLAAMVFGFCFAFIGQLGDLAESMIKRDTEQKDSANSVPGFGGILDVVDSPLVAAPFAYLVFMWVF